MSQESWNLTPKSQSCEIKGVKEMSNNRYSKRHKGGKYQTEEIEKYMKQHGVILFDSTANRTFTQKIT